MACAGLSGNPPSGSPKLTEWHYHYKGSLLELELGLGNLTIT